MYFLLKGIIDIAIVILLLRLLIKPREAFFDPIYGLIYRVTDPLLIPATYVTRNSSLGTILTILALVVLRGGVYVLIRPMSLFSGIGISLWSLFHLLFQAYMVMWVVSLVSARSFGASFLLLIDRAFSPLQWALRSLGVPSRRFRLFVFLFLLMLYTLVSNVILYAIDPKAVLTTVSFIQGLGEGLKVVLGLFQFPGFFSLVIIAGAVLSWISPDPHNPVVQAIYGINEPLLRPFRRYVPPLGGLDLSPIVALLCFQLLGGFGQKMIEGLLGMV